MSPDSELLRRFAEHEDQHAFTELVGRHINLVYCTALRRLAGDSHLAQDVAQIVFTNTARKAKTLAGVRVFSSWLYTSTCYASAKVVRAEQRRKKREAAAQTMHAFLKDSAEDEAWKRLRPVLDDALHDLQTKDREAILLRYFDGRPFVDIGERLCLTENAARMRVERALEKLRIRLHARGLTSTAAALSAAIATHAVAAAPAGLANSVAASAVASIASGTSISLLAWLTMNKTLAVSTVALLSASAVGVHFELKAQSDLARQTVRASEQRAAISNLRQEIAVLSKQAEEIALLRSEDAALEKLQSDAAKMKSELASTPSSSASPHVLESKSSRTAAAGIYDISQLDRMPQIKTQKAPRFPFEMRRASVSGGVTVSFVVTPEGNVADARTSDATHKNFEVPALEVVRNWTFTPGLKDGRPVATKMSIPIQFQIDSDDPLWF